MRTRRPVASAGMMIGLLIGLGAGTAAFAETPPDLDPGYVTDLSGVLSAGEEAELEQRLGELASADGRPELFVILVPDFEDPANALAWADETALRNNLAPDQYLLAVATDGRSLAISAEYGGGGVDAGPLSESRVLDIESTLGSDYLADADWVGGISYVADEFDTVPWPWWVWVLGLAGLALVVFLAVRLILFLRHRAALAAELRTLDGQKARAARLLVRTDEAVRTSEQELGFVTAEFGDETTADFAGVLAECRTRLQEAFELLEKLQDAEKDTAQETRTWTDTIIRLCGEVDGSLEGRKRELASLRSLADNGTDTLARLQTARAEAASLQTETAEKISALTAVFPASDLIGVSDNADEIAGRLHGADVQLAALQTAVQGRKPKGIARAVHETERLLAEAKDLRDAVEAQADALAARSTAPAASDASTIPDAAATASATTAAAPAIGSPVDRAGAAVRAAEITAQARPGEVSAFALSRLNLAKRQLDATRAAVDPAEADRLAAATIATGEQVLSLVGTRASSVNRRYVRTAPSSPADEGAVMYDTPSSGSSTSWRRSYVYEDENEGRGGKAVLGGIGGGVVGFISSLGVAGEAPGLIVMFVLGGIVLGALSGAFGGEGGGSSSGWGGSSSGWGGSSRSSSRGGSSRSSGSRSSGSSGGSRSSGRSGGRRF